MCCIIKLVIWEDQREKIDHGVQNAENKKGPFAADGRQKAEVITALKKAGSLIVKELNRVLRDA